jgi:hypothetical protein
LKTEKEISRYLEENINPRNISFFSILLSLNRELVVEVMDLMISGNIDIYDIIKLSTIDSESLQLFIDRKKYYGVPVDIEIKDDLFVFDWVKEEFHLNNLLLSVREKPPMLYSSDFVPKVLANDPSDFRSYPTEESVLNEFLNKVLPAIKNEMEFSNIQDIFPTSNISIENLFYPLNGNYTYESVSYKISDLGIKMYNDLFSSFFDYFNDQSLFYLLYQINKRQPKITITPRIVSNMLNLIVPEKDTIYDFTNHFASLFISEINQMIELDLEMKELYSGFDENIYLTRFIFANSPSILDWLPEYLGGLLYNASLLLTPSTSLTLIKGVTAISKWAGLDLNMQNCPNPESLTELTNIIMNKIILFKKLLEVNFKLANEMLPVVL